MREKTDSKNSFNLRTQWTSWKRERNKNCQLKRKHGKNKWIFVLAQIAVKGLKRLEKSKNEIIERSCRYLTKFSKKVQWR